MKISQSLAQSDDASMANMTNATILSNFYRRRHQRYRNVTSPRWGDDTAGVASSILPNGTRGGRLDLDLLGQWYELTISPVGGQPKAPGGEASLWNGVDTLISPSDAAIFSSLLWQHKPDLVVEIGTECGGSAIFFASIMRMYNPHAVVLTYDTMPTYCLTAPMIEPRQCTCAIRPLRPFSGTQTAERPHSQRVCSVQIGAAHGNRMAGARSRGTNRPYGQSSRAKVPL